MHTNYKKRLMVLMHGTTVN